MTEESSKMERWTSFKAICNCCKKITIFKQKIFNKKQFLLSLASLIGWVFYIIYYLNLEPFYCSECNTRYTKEYVSINLSKMNAQ